MKTKPYLIVLLLSIYLLMGCGRISTSITTPEVTPPASPETGKATLTGRIISSITGQPLGITIVRLAEVYRQGGEGAYALNIGFSPGAISDDKGYFIIENIDAKEYVIVVGDVFDIYKVIEGDDRKARVWNLEADIVLDIGELSVEFQK